MMRTLRRCPFESAKLITFMDFENSYGQILSFEVLRIYQICFSHFHIQDLRQSRSKKLKAKLVMYFVLASIWVFEWRATTNKSFPCLYWRSGE